jgi:hypothetical protein
MRSAIFAAALALAALAAGTATAKDRPPVVSAPRSDRPVFVLDKGRLTAFDAPGTGPVEFPRVNERGQIVGGYGKPDGTSGGYLRDARGRVALFDAPGAKETTALDVNNRGWVVGNTCDASPCQTRWGFLRDQKGRFRPIRVPGSLQTQAYGIDERGRVVGDYLDARGVSHGYLWEKGRFKTIDVRGAVMTTVTAINERSEMVGLYATADGRIHGYFRNRRGHISTINAPDAPYTFPFGLNNHGQIVGLTTTAPSLGPDNNDVHGFLLNGPNSQFVRIDVPGATDTGTTGIDNRGRIVGLYENPNAAPTGAPSRAAASPSLDALALGYRLMKDER